MRSTQPFVAVLLVLFLGGCNGTGDPPAVTTTATSPILIGDGVYQEATAVAPLPTGGHIVAGQRTDAGTPLLGPSVYVVRLDNELGVVWERVHHDMSDDEVDTQTLDVAVSPDGSVSFVCGDRFTATDGNDAFLMKIDNATGDLLESVVYRTDIPEWGVPDVLLRERFDGVSATVDGGCLVAGTIWAPLGHADVVVAKYSASLEQTWLTRIESADSAFGYGIVVLKSGQMLVGGRAASTDGTSADLRLHRLDAAGAPTASTDHAAGGDQNRATAAFAYQESPPDVIPRSSIVGVVLTGSTYPFALDLTALPDVAHPVVVFVDEAGNEQWTTSIPGDASDYLEILGTSTLTNDGVVLVGRRASGPSDLESDAVIWRLDAAGTSIGAPEIIDAEHQRVLADTDGRVAVGGAAAAPSGGGMQMWIVPLAE